MVDWKIYHCSLSILIFLWYQRNKDNGTLKKQLIKTWLDGCIVCYSITSLFSFPLESLASVTLLILVDVLLYVSDLKWGHNITASEVTIMEVYFYHKAFERYMLDVIWKSGNQKAEMTLDEPKTISWLNLQTERFGFKKKPGRYVLARNFVHLIMSTHKIFHCVCLSCRKNESKWKTTPRKLHHNKV